MLPERTRVALRLRTGWEAIDLGFRMVRRWWRPIAIPWLIAVLPIAAVGQLALSDQPWLAVGLLWWLKPLFDRIPLYVLGEAFFGHTPSLRETARAAPGLLRSGVVRSLLWLRLTPLRAAGQPVLQLEGLRGVARSARTRQLIGRDNGVAFGLHLACFGFELAVFGALFQLADGFLPEELMPTREASVWTALGDASPWLVTAFYVIAMTAVEPFYVGAGFGLYINRRVYLEGWDIDLVFRRLARRLESGPGRTTRARVAALVALAALGAAPAALAGDEPIRCAAERPEDARPCIDRIMDTDEFEQVHTSEYWVPTWIDFGEGEADAPPSEFLAGVMALLAGLARVVVWVGVAAALAAVAYAALRRLRPPEPRTPGAREPALVERDLRAGGLPGDPVGAARERWQAGDAAGALSLLYRAGIAYLVDDCGLDLPDGATEGECERLARRVARPGVAEDFGELVRAWQHCAYARLAPDDATFTELCRRWSARTRVAS